MRVRIGACTVRAQVYQVGPGVSQASPAPSGGVKNHAQSLGWGSNIENARLGRAAEMALQRRDYARALDYAQRATQAAPNDPQLWFLLGYAARLDGKYPAIGRSVYTRPSPESFGPRRTIGPGSGLQLDGAD